MKKQLSEKAEKLFTRIKSKQRGQIHVDSKDIDEDAYGELIDAGYLCYLTKMGTGRIAFEVIL